MNKICLLLLFIVSAAFGQEKYIFKANMRNIPLQDVLKHADSIFRVKSEFSFEVNASYLLPYKEIASESCFQAGYKEKQLRLIKKDSLNPVYYGNLGFYYLNQGEKATAMEYYNKALKKMPYYKIQKDSSRFYSYKGTIKFNLGQDGAYEMEKALSINKKDSLAIGLYPLYLINNNRFFEAEKLCESLMDDQKFKYFGYLMIYTAKFTEYSHFLVSQSDKGTVISNMGVKTSIDMSSYDKYFAQNDIRFEIERELVQVPLMFTKSVAILADKNYKMPAAELHYINEKEAFFMKMLNQKDVNYFALNMAVANLKIAKKDFDGAIEYLNKSIAIFPRNKCTLRFNNLDAYINLSSIYLYLEDYDKMIDVIKAMISEKIVTPEIKAHALLNIAKIYFRKNDLDAALDYAYQALAVEETFDSDLFISYIYLRRGSNDLGSRYAEKAEKLSTTLENLNDIINYHMAIQIARGFPDYAVTIFNDNKDNLRGACKSCEYMLSHYLEEKK